MSQIEIILGPTNTGKTFYAFEQMFSYQSGVFGFPCTRNVNVCACEASGPVGP